MVKKIAAIVPGPAVFFIGKWLELFSSTNLTYPEWQSEADKLALGLGAFVTIILCLTLRNAPKGLLLALSLIGFALTLGSVIGCRMIWHHLGTPMMVRSEVIWWQDVWQDVYVAAMVFLIATITVAGLYEGEKHPLVFWAVFSIIIVFLVIIGAYFVWLYLSARPVAAISREQMQVVTAAALSRET